MCLLPIFSICWFAINYASAQRAGGIYIFVLSVRLSVLLSVRPSVRPLRFYLTRLLMNRLMDQAENVGLY